LRPTSFTASTMPVAITLQSMIPPKMFTKIPFTFGSPRMILNACDDLVLGGAAADVEEVGRVAAEVLDDVHRAHREPGAVDQARDVVPSRAM
jgi:hypothetical protein